jgi:hypothetical protein
MKELYFTSPYRRSLRTIRLEYGQVKKVFILRTFDGEINGRGTSESPPKEQIFENEQGLLKKVYEIKSGLLEGRWIVQNKQSISQPSFISTNIIDGEVSIEFDN